MACFLVPAAEAVIVTAAAQAVKIKEKKEAEKMMLNQEIYEEHASMVDMLTMSRKLQWLSYFLWGGSFLLCFEHIWHGEVVPWFPFLTAADSQADLLEMLNEMSTVGVTMSMLVTVVWFGIVLAASMIAKRENETEISVN